MMQKAITMRAIEGKRGEVYYPLQISHHPRPIPRADELLVQLTAAALNHRDVFLRQLLYPGASQGITLGSDGAGFVIATGPHADPKWLGKSVILNPGTGWKDHPEAPEASGGYRVMGGSTRNPKGTLQEFLVIAESEVELAPRHLSVQELAAFPVAGLTAWRALVSKSGNAQPGRNILVTGIGGGVALMAFEFARAAGCNVFVTSSSADKLKRAMEMGAKGGVNYHDVRWEEKLVEQLPMERKELDAIVDGAGGNIVEKGVTILRTGGVIVSYGMTVAPTMPFPMRAVMKQVDLRTSTMGSRKEFADMVAFVRTNHIRPVVSRVVDGLDDLERIEDLFEEIKRGKQFGKLVVRMGGESHESKL